MFFFIYLSIIPSSLFIIKNLLDQYLYFKFIIEFNKLNKILFKSFWIRQMNLMLKFLLLFSIIKILKSIIYDILIKIVKKNLSKIIVVCTVHR